MLLYELRLQTQFQYLAVVIVSSELLLHEIRVTGNSACSLLAPGGLGLIHPHLNIIYQLLNSSFRKAFGTSHIRPCIGG